MLVKEIKFEDFLNYKKPSMFIATCFCNWKCCKDHGYDISICQNSSIAKQPNIRINDDEIVSRYLSNKIVEAIVFSGLEPFDQWEELHDLISEFRNFTDDDIVIYTGYEEEDLEKKSILQELKKFKNIIVKFGRFIPNSRERFDPVLGVTLASPNQIAKKIS